jgi:hypothetical protein
MKFKGVVELGGKTATGIEVPAKVVDGLGSTKRPAVTVTINGYTYRSTIAPMGGKYYLPLSAQNRAGAKVEAGDKVEVTVELDTKPRKVEVPVDFKKALAKDAAAKRFFAGLSYSRQRWFAESVTSAKKPETRQKRIDDAVAMLRAGKPGR